MTITEDDSHTLNMNAQKDAEMVAIYVWPEAKTEISLCSKRSRRDGGEEVREGVRQYIGSRSAEEEDPKAPAQLRLYREEYSNLKIASSTVMVMANDGSYLDVFSTHTITITIL